MRSGRSIAVGATYTCSFAVRAAGRGIISDVLTVTATGGTGEIPAATAAASVDSRVRPARSSMSRGCGPLAPSGGSRDSHCRARHIFVAMLHGAPVAREHALVRASTAARPATSAGRHRVWTLRVERVAQRIGSTHPAGSIERIFVGWEATPTAIAKKRGARYL